MRAGYPYFGGNQWEEMTWTEKSAAIFGVMEDSRKQMKMGKILEHPITLTN
jgi:hypothetical protein